MSRSVLALCTLLLVGCIASCSNAPEAIDMRKGDNDLRIDGAVFNTCIPIERGKKLRVAALSLSNTSGKKITLDSAELIEATNAKLTDQNIQPLQNDRSVPGLSWDYPGIKSSNNPSGALQPLSGFAVTSGKDAPAVVLLGVTPEDDAKPLHITRIAFTYTVDGKQRRREVRNSIDTAVGECKVERG